MSAGGLTVRVKRGLASLSAEHPELEPDESAAEPAAPEEPREEQTEQEEGALIRAGMVGIFHQVDGILPGAAVKPGQTLGLIQSMKLMNEVKSTVSGVVREVFVEDGSPVEYGQKLFAVTETE